MTGLLRFSAAPWLLSRLSPACSPVALVKPAHILSRLLSTLLLSAWAMASMAHAAPTTSGETFQYHPAKLQQVCRGKSAGAPAVLIMNGVIFNGTCEVQYLPSHRNQRLPLDALANPNVCAGQSVNSAVSMRIDGRDMPGKCVLAYRNILPMPTTD